MKRSVLLLLFLSSCGVGELLSDEPSDSLRPPVRDMAYAGILRSSGKWTCMIESSDDQCPAGNKGSEAVPGILAANPRYVRVANAGEQVCHDGTNTCPREQWLVGVPDKGTAEYDALIQMKDAGMHLGIHINGKSRSADAILDHASRIYIRDGELSLKEGRPRFYDWIQVDFAFERAKKDGNREKVDKIFKGLRDQGWLVWANETGWEPGQNALLGRPAWVHAKRFELIVTLRNDCTNGDNQIVNSPACDATVQDITNRALNGGDVILERDKRFLEAVHDVDPDAEAMLKLEIYGQINVFKKKLSPQVQRALFYRWAEAQDCVKVDGNCRSFKMFYPLAVPNAGDGEGEKGQNGTPIAFHPYVSWRPEAETFCEMKALIEYFDPKQQGKPAAQCAAPNGNEPVFWK